MGSIMSENMSQQPFFAVFVPAAIELTQGSIFLLNCVSAVPFRP